MKNYKEHQVTIQGEYILKGTLTAPQSDKDKYPAVLLLSGSGKGDRDGNIKAKNLNMNIYAMLAEAICEMGFITLRYDKRGIGESKGDYMHAGMWDFIRDGEAAIQFLKRQPNVDAEKIIVLGHSEGAMLATTIASRNDIAGAILLAGAAENLAEATKRQRMLAYDYLNQLPGIKGRLVRALHLTEKAEKKNETFFKKMIQSKDDVMKVQLFFPINAKWMREHFTHNVLEDLQKVNCPVLAVTGSRDAQANPERVKDVASYVKGPSASVIIENMNHILKEQDVEVPLPKLIAYYKTLKDKPLHPELVPVLKQWLDNDSDRHRYGYLF